MQMEYIPVTQIVNNPWRNTDLFPISADHVRELTNSIGDHGFFGGIKARRRNGQVELGCGHARVEAARIAGLKEVPIFIDDLDDDEMLRLMTDENATQAGSSPGAALNEVAAITQRIIEGLLRDGGTIVPPSVKLAIEGGDTGAAKVISNLRNGTDVHLVLGHNVIRRYLGQGELKRSTRTERQIREAITTLKQDGRYDDIVERAVSAHPTQQPEPDDGATPKKAKKKGKAVAAAKPKKPRRPRIYDAHCANVFPNEHQAQAFREAVTTRAAQRVLPVENQYALAQEIMNATHSDFSKKQVGAPFIKVYVQGKVAEGLAKQRDVNKAEREAYLAEQREARIDDELHSAKASVRSLISAMVKLEKLAREFPSHPKLGGFSEKLTPLVQAIKQFQGQLK